MSIWSIFGKQPLGGRRKPHRMKLRFAVNQAAAWRRGVECLKPLVSLEVDLEQLDAAVRQQLQARLLGADVCESFLRADGSVGPAIDYFGDTYGDPEREGQPRRLVAELPTLEGLIEALSRDQQRINEELRLRQPGHLAEAA